MELKPMLSRAQQGFTLIELMIVVAIIAVIAAIAMPSYKESVRRTKRVEMQTEMGNISSRLAAYKMTNNSYQNAVLSNTALYGGSTFPKSGSDIRYGLVLAKTDSNGDGLDDSWTLTATPQGSQINDGSIVLNDQGWKCWAKGAAVCTLSATSDWSH